MLVFISVILLAAVSVAFRIPANDSVIPTTRCGAHVSAEQLIEYERHFHSFKVPPRMTLSAKAVPEIEVTIHVVSADQSSERGWISDEQIASQMEVLNRDYQDAGLSWTLVSTNHVINKTWYEGAGMGNKLQDEMKRELRVGGPASLNVYTVGFVAEDVRGILGYSSYPVGYQYNPTEDGIVMMFSTVPGGSYTNYNEGRTLTHEAGHWVGLYHTFMGGCDGDGDMVSDTPPEASAASGCPQNRDTCSGGGSDPIHNFMDYSFDSCMTQFTPGQIMRLSDQLRTYRGIDI